MREQEETGMLGFALGTLLGVGIASASHRRNQRNPFRRQTGFRIASSVSVSQLADGNWDIDPYRLQLPRAGTPVTVTWTLDAATKAEGFSFDPVRGITVQDGGGNFSHPRLNHNGSFSVDAANDEPHLEFKYGIALLKHGELHFTIDPPVRNGPGG